MNDHLSSNWKAMGLDFHSPFEILSRPRAELKERVKPKKVRKTRHQQVLAALEDPVTTSHFNTPIPTREESDRTISIRMGVV